MLKLCKILRIANDGHGKSVANVARVQVGQEIQVLVLQSRVVLLLPGGCEEQHAAAVKAHVSHVETLLAKRSNVGITVGSVELPCR